MVIWNQDLRRVLERVVESTGPSAPEERVDVDTYDDHLTSDVSHLVEYPLILWRGRA